MERWDKAVETGYLRIETGLVEHAGNMFSTRELPPDIALPPMTVEQAIHLLHMHKNEVRDMGRRPGKLRRPPSLEELRPGILRKLEAIEGRRLAEERVAVKTRAADRAEYARRRPGGNAG